MYHFISCFSLGHIWHPIYEPWYTDLKQFPGHHITYTKSESLGMKPVKI